MQDKALFTIVVTGTAGTVANLVKQLSKLVKVRYVEDITMNTKVGECRHGRTIAASLLGAPISHNRRKLHCHVVVAVVVHKRSSIFVLHPDHH